MSRALKVELFAIFLYCMILAQQDKREGILSAAHMCRWYASKCREIGTWLLVQAIRADNAARELVEP